MAKRSGLAELAFIGGYSLGGDMQSYAYNGGPAAIDVTGIESSAHERIGGLFDGKVSGAMFFNDAVGQAHPVLSLLPTTDADVMILHGQTLGNAAMFARAKQMNYDGNRGADGSLTFAVERMINGYAVQCGEALTAGIRTESTATNGASVDGGAQTAFGLAFAVQVTALGSGSPTIKLQDSANDSTWADISGATAGVVAANGTYFVRIGATATVRRYVRVITTGTFSGLSFACVFNRYPVATP